MFKKRILQYFQLNRSFLSLFFILIFFIKLSNLFNFCYTLTLIDKDYPSNQTPG